MPVITDTEDSVDSASQNGREQGPSTEHLEQQHYFGSGQEPTGRTCTVSHVQDQTEVTFRYLDSRILCRLSSVPIHCQSLFVGWRSQEVEVCTEPNSYQYACLLPPAVYSDDQPCSSRG